MASPSLDELARRVLDFRDRRDWSQFHNPKDVAVSLAIEAAEVLELFQWKNGAELEAHLESKRDELGQELSDVLYWVLLLAHDSGVDLAAAFEEKMKRNEAKYPVAKAKGSSKKYTEL